MSPAPAVFAAPTPSPAFTAAERALAAEVQAGRGAVVNVRRGGPHARLVPWLVERDLLVYVGHAGARHGWPGSDFANPFLRERADRPAMVARYRDWLAGRDDLLERIAAGELAGKALGCWCAPQACHADVLLAEARRWA